MKEAIARVLKTSHKEDKPMMGREININPKGKMRATIKRARKKDLKYSIICFPEVRGIQRFSLSEEFHVVAKIDGTRAL